MKKILILEDDIELNQGISYALKKEGYDVISSYSIEDAKKQMMQATFAIVILDVTLPDGDGFSFCKWLKKHFSTTVLFLSARDLEKDILIGYELGAHDYVTKPFSIRILLKKIEVILHQDSKATKNSFNDGFLKINFDSGNITVKQQICYLTPTELRLVKIFIDHQGQLLTYSVLLEHFWDTGSQFIDKHALAVNINRLRKKIEDKEHLYITNIYGMGYIWK